MTRIACDSFMLSGKGMKHALHSYIVMQLTEHHCIILVHKQRDWYRWNRDLSECNFTLSLFSQFEHMRKQTRNIRFSLFRFLRIQRLYMYKCKKGISDRLRGYAG